MPASRPQRRRLQVQTKRNPEGGERVEVMEADLRDPESLRRGMAGCELVFHVGALYSFWVRPRRLIYEVNVDGTRRVFDAAKAAFLASASRALPERTNPSNSVCEGASCLRPPGPTRRSNSAEVTLASENEQVGL